MDSYHGTRVYVRTYNVMSQLSGWKRAHMCTEDRVCFGTIHGSQLREGANAGQHTPTLSLPPSHHCLNGEVSLLLVPTSESVQRRAQREALDGLSVAASYDTLGALSFGCGRSLPSLIIHQRLEAPSPTHVGRAGGKLVLISCCSPPV
jgi:hypothetical protein